MKFIKSFETFVPRDNDREQRAKEKGILLVPKITKKIKVCTSDICELVELTHVNTATNYISKVVLTGGTSMYDFEIDIRHDNVKIIFSKVTTTGAIIVDPAKFLSMDDALSVLKYVVYYLIDYAYRDANLKPSIQKAEEKFELLSKYLIEHKDELVTSQKEINSIKGFKNYNSKQGYLGESVVTDKEFNPYEELRKIYKKKKWSLRALDNYVIEKSDRRSSLNPYALRSRFVGVCIEDNTLINDENWQYVFDNYNTTATEGLKLIKLIVEKYKPSTKQIIDTFENLIERFRIGEGYNNFRKSVGNDILAADYLITLISDKDLLKIIHKSICIRYQNDSWRINWFVNKGFITCKPQSSRTYHIDAIGALDFLQHTITEYSGWDILKDPLCEYPKYFFETIKKHPNNGGLNVSDERFSKVLYKLFHIKNFRDYVEANTDTCQHLELMYNEFFHKHED